MLTIFSLICIISIIVVVFSFAILLVREKAVKDREKINPFECGFSPINKARAPFSLRFFIVTLIFLIFDIEIALILPFGVISKIDNLFIFNLSSFLVVFILIFGLLHEWKQGALKWIK